MIKCVQAKIEQIRANLDDDEKCHVLEDELYEFVIRYVADHPKVPRGVKALCRLVLYTKELKFNRWCA